MGGLKPPPVGRSRRAYLHHPYSINSRSLTYQPLSLFRTHAVFTSPLGHLRDPSNTQADLRDVFDRIKYPDVTSHTFRRTVATLMDEAGLSARAAADQLGHAKVSMTQDHYFGRKRAKTGAAGVLESMEQAGTTTNKGNGVLADSRHGSDPSES
jgi:integrase